MEIIQPSTHSARIADVEHAIGVDTSLKDVRNALHDTLQKCNANFEGTVPESNHEGALNTH